MSINRSIVARATELVRNSEEPMYWHRAVMQAIRETYGDNIEAYAAALADTCHWCGRGYSATDAWEIDHITALANGGTNHLSNLALCHKSCNRDKGTLT